MISFRASILSADRIVENRAQAAEVADHPFGPSDLAAVHRVGAADLVQHVIHGAVHLVEQLTDLEGAGSVSVQIF